MSILVGNHISYIDYHSLTAFLSTPLSLSYSLFHDILSSSYHPYFFSSSSSFFQRSLNRQQFLLVVNLTRILMKKVIKMRSDEMGTLWYIKYNKFMSDMIDSSYVCFFTSYVFLIYHKWFSRLHQFFNGVIVQCLWVLPIA